MKGKLFAFEGIDGGGKTTQVKILADRLTKLGLLVFVSKALKDDSEKNKQLFRSLIANFDIPKNSIAMMFLFQALHSEQYEQTKKTLKEGYIVLADRWNASFWAYHQNFGPLREESRILKVLDDLAFQGLIPDITFLLDLPVEIALERKRLQQREVVDIFEQEDLRVFERIREAYLEMAKSRSNWAVIDATKTISEVHRLVWKVISEELELGAGEI